MSEHPKAPDLLRQFDGRLETPEFLELKKLKLKETELKGSILSNFIGSAMLAFLYLVALIDTMIGENKTLIVICAFGTIIGIMLFILSFVKERRECDLVESGEDPFFDQDENEYPKSIVKLKKRIKILNRIDNFLSLLFFILVILPYPYSRRHYATKPLPLIESSNITIVPVL